MSIGGLEAGCAIERAHGLFGRSTGEQCRSIGGRCIHCWRSCRNTRRWFAHCRCLKGAAGEAEWVFEVFEMASGRSMARLQKIDHQELVQQDCAAQNSVLYNEGGRVDEVARVKRARSCKTRLSGSSPARLEIRNLNFTRRSARPLELYS